MNGEDRPGAAFGRRGREAHASVGIAGDPARPARNTGRIAYLFGLAVLFLAVAGAIVCTLASLEKLNADTAHAKQRVVEIVNQPVTHLPRSGPVEFFSPGWFHPGAVTPDFNHVDIRATQEFPYQGHVTSDLNPTEMFIGSELEFNPMTKYFYTDRTLPKKRLSDAEMVEINNLYRVIGRDKQALSTRWMAMAGLILVEACLVYGLFVLIRKSYGRLESMP